MYNLIPQKLIRLAQSLQKPLYVVGGACRDFIAGLKGENCDWDICAPVRAEEFSAAAERAGFKVSAVFKNTGTVLLCSAVIGAFIWVFDFVSVSLVQMILSAFGA